MEDVQHEVERQLGRCMLRLQQYELLLKKMMSSMAVEGPLEQIEAILENRVTGMRSRTLGMLIADFVGHHLTSASPDDETDGAESGSSDVPYLRMHVAISMSHEREAQTRAGLAELVRLRNDLVHHIYEAFDLSSEAGYSALSAHLKKCHARIDDHYQALEALAVQLSKCRALASSFIQSKQFEDAFGCGILRDGTVSGPHSSIVEYLRKAEAACQVEGWTSLDAAILFISREDRSQTPRGYGCRTWRQVLKQSGQFEVRLVPGAGGSKAQVWYRSDTGACASLRSPAG